jgi:uncharacterized protein (UPF0332 family)
MLWDGFQDTADRLAHGVTEGDWRSAISRGYYAVFHYFRAFLLSHGLDIGKSGQAHFNLYVGLWNCGFPNVAAVANWIDILRIHRVTADYNLAPSIGQADAKSDVQESRAVVADFQALLPRTSSAHITDGARRYLQGIDRLGKTP